MPKICFIANNAYGAFAGIDTGHTGGIEKQTSLMARLFASQGYPVSMITWDNGQDDGVEIDGVHLYKLCRRDAGLPILRFFWPRWTSFNAAMKRADADIYYYNCGDLGLGQVAMWCRRHGKKSVYSVASNPDCDVALPVLKYFRERFLYRYGLTNADAILVQNQTQQKMLEDGFNLKSKIIPMPCKALGPKLKLDITNETRILWVGRISKEKRFEWLLDVAEKCPNITFDVLGASNTNSDYSINLIQRAKNISNVIMHGRVAHADIAKFYCQANVLCCTSEYEGFPNTFLEAWSVALPLVTTFDPDAIVARNDIGWTATSKGELIAGIREAISDRDKWKACSGNALSYYLANHTVEACMSKYADVFEETNKKK